MQIGYKASAEQFDPTTLAQFAVRAEQVGLDSVFVSDHVQPWRVTGGHAPNALVWLGFAAARTERVTLGTSVLTPTYRYNPVVIAQTFATLGVLAPDRVVLGVGTGEALNEIAIGAIEAGHWPDFKERFGRLREAVRLIRALWADEVVDFEGDYYRTQGARIYDRPEQPVPIYIAAGGPTMAKYAGRAGDGFICTSGKGMSLYADKLVPAVAEGRAAAGKPEQGLARMIEIKLSYDPDPVQALENTRFWAPLSLDAEARSTTRPRWRLRPTPCRSSRSPRAGSWPRPLSRSCRRCSRTSISVSITWSSTRPAQIRTASSPPSPSRYSRLSAS